MLTSPTRPRPMLAMIAVCLGTFMLIIDVQIIVVALPSIRDSLHTTFTEEQWTIDAYSVTLAALLLPAGSIADILGRRKMFAVGLGGFTLGSLFCGTATSGMELVISAPFRALAVRLCFRPPLPSSRSRLRAKSSVPCWVFEALS